MVSYLSKLVKLQKLHTSYCYSDLTNAYEDIAIFFAWNIKSSQTLYHHFTIFLVLQCDRNFACSIVEILYILTDMLYLRQPAVGLSPKTSGFHLRSFYVRYVVKRMTLEKNSLLTYQLSGVTLIPAVLHTHIHLYTIGVILATDSVIKQNIPFSLYLSLSL